MKVIQVVPCVGYESAGPAYSVPASTIGLVENGVDAEVYTIGKKSDRIWRCPIKYFKLEKFPTYKLGRSPELKRALRNVASDADIIHTNSLWMFPNVYQASAVKRTKCKTVIGPRGTVSRWALSRSRIIKFIFGHLWQYRAMRKADMFVASCQEEADDIRSLGYKQPIALITNGVDLPNEHLVAEAVKYKLDVNNRRRMYFLSRIHPKKNLELLITCWAKLEKKFPDWDLSIVGPDKGNDYADKMKNLSRELGCHRVTFEGEITGKEKTDFVAKSECLVLPTHSENFGMVVAEALAAGTPAICSKGAPWSGLETSNSGMWVDLNEDAFILAMEHVMSMRREVLVEMGKNGRQWMSNDFSWKGIGKKLKCSYEWLLTGGEKPDWIV